MSIMKKVEQQIHKEMVQKNRKARGFEIYTVTTPGKLIQVEQLELRQKVMTKKEMLAFISKNSTSVVDRTQDMYEQLWTGGHYPAFLYEVKGFKSYALYLCKKI